MNEMEEKPAAKLVYVSSISVLQCFHYISTISSFFLLFADQPQEKTAAASEQASSSNNNCGVGERENGKQTFDCEREGGGEGDLSCSS